MSLLARTRHDPADGLLFHLPDAVAPAKPGQRRVWYGDLVPGLQLLLHAYQVPPALGVQVSQRLRVGLKPMRLALTPPHLPLAARNDPHDRAAPHPKVLGDLAAPVPLPVQRQYGHP